MIAALFLNRYVFSALAVLAMMAGIYFAWEHYVAKPYVDQGKAIGLKAGIDQGKTLGIAQGRAAERAELIPVIESLKLRLDRDVDAFKTISVYLAQIKAGNDRIKKQLDKANALNARRVQTTKTRIEYIDRLVPVGNTECEKTADAVSKVLR